MINKWLYVFYLLHILSAPYIILDKLLEFFFLNMQNLHKLVFHQPVKIYSRASKFGLFLARQKLHTDWMLMEVSVNPLSDTRWRFIWKNWMTALSCELRGQSSICD